MGESIYREASLTIRNTLDPIGRLAQIRVPPRYLNCFAILVFGFWFLGGGYEEEGVDFYFCVWGNCGEIVGPRLVTVRTGES